jgi:hypothetical protein
VGTHNEPLYLVDFRGHDNRAAIPWTKQWYRKEWIQHVEEKPERGVETRRPVETS